ncbi:Reticulon-4 Foocen [Triplophysa tibetana]|uniref:Reticulon n=1 Tax=Triplophysa tibetana TaxID=1572043 RepID=A0A5A9P9M0_9TELE|nr:Reticulon-4 Foocen [Triplophysa tibetana]
MEDADKVSSCAPEEIPRKESNAARGESMSRDEKNISPHTNEDNSTPQIPEENVIPHITEEQISSQITEENITSEITEENITAQTSEENVTPHITEEQIYSQISEENITRQINNENVTPSITEESFITTTETKKTPTATEIRVTPQESETARSSQRTAQSSAREGPEGSLQDSEVSCVSQKTEVTSSALSEATCVSQTAAEVSSSLITVSSAQTRHTTDLTPEEIPEKKPSLHPFSSLCEHPPVPAPAPQFSTDLRHSSAVVSQDSGAYLTMESFRQNSAEFDPTVLNQTSEDDFQFEMKNCSFHPFSTVRDSVRSVVSDSSSPDLVQDAYDGDDDVTQPQEIKVLFDSEAITSRSHLEQLDSSVLFSNVNKEGDDRPTSLPDILKSSPLNPDKVDSGSSEGSPDLSPAHRSGSDSPNSQISVSANIPLGLDSKILLLKEMAEVTEARGVETTNLDPEKIPEQSFVAFDLVKETDMTPKSEHLLKDKVAETSVQMKDKFECLHFPTEKAQGSDSESPSADSFSPVLDVVAKRPVEYENTNDREEIEAIDEVSEQEVSSEEFEFVERPPRGAADEFMEIQDNETFYEEQFPGLEPSSAGNAEDQSSYHLLSLLSEESSHVRGKTGLETSFKASLIQTPADQSGLEKTEVSSLSSARAASVLDVVYWRDLGWSAVVFSFSLLLLLSLSCCSVVSVMAYTTLALLSLTVTFRIYKAILQAVQKSDKGHPFKQYLDIDVALKTDVVQEYSDVALRRINGGLTELRRLFLVEDLVDSLKFAVFLWILTYVGAVFNGLTLVILGLVGAFSGPVIYEQHQAQIDAFVSMVKNQMKDFWGKIQAKVPGMKK